MVITEVACGINCTYSTALFNKYGLDCTAAEHTLGTAGFQGTVRNSETYFAGSLQSPKEQTMQIKSFRTNSPPLECLLLLSVPPLLSFVSEMKGNTGKLPKPLVIIIMETKQRIQC